MRAPRTAQPLTTPVRTGLPGGPEAARPVWLWSGSGPALTPRGLVPLQIEGAAPAVVTPHGPGLRIERGTTNLVTNPSFEVDMSGWSAVAGAAISRQTSGGGAFGDAYARVDVTSTGHGIRVTGFGNAAQGDTYAASMHLRAASPSDIGKTVQVYLDSSGGTYEIGAIDHVLGAEWHRVTLTRTWLLSGHSGWGLSVRDAIGQGVVSFCMDGAQYEAAGPSPYADGALGAGHEWQGTAHASISTRESSRVFGNRPVGGAPGTAVIGAAPDWSGGDGGSRVLFSLVDDSGKFLNLRSTGEGAWVAEFVWPGGLEHVSLDQTHDAGELVLLSLEWTENHLGIRRGANAASAAIPLGVGFRATTMWIGCSYDDEDWPLGGVLHLAALHSSPLATADWLALHRRHGLTT